MTLKHATLTTSVDVVFLLQRIDDSIEDGSTVQTLRCYTRKPDESAMMLTKAGTRGLLRLLGLLGQMVPLGMLSCDARADAAIIDH